MIYGRSRTLVSHLRLVSERGYHVAQAMIRGEHKHYHEYSISSAPTVHPIQQSLDMQQLHICVDSLTPHPPELVNFVRLTVWNCAVERCKGSAIIDFHFNYTLADPPPPPRPWRSRRRVRVVPPPTGPRPGLALPARPSRASALESGSAPRSTVSTPQHPGRSAVSTLLCSGVKA